MAGLVWNGTQPWQAWTILVRTLTFDSYVFDKTKQNKTPTARHHERRRKRGGKSGNMKEEKKGGGKKKRRGWRKRRSGITRKRKPVRM